MNENSYLKKLNQVCVYWPSPTPDGWGNFTFAAPVELSCRWVDKNELYIDAKGNESRSKSVVYVNIDLDKEGFLLLDSLANLSVAEKADPNLTLADQIRGYSKIPGVRGTFFVRNAWL